jgi:hypothetical protein
MNIMTTECICPRCGFDVAAPVLARVRVMHKPWGGPAPYLSGYLSDMQELQTLGYANQDKAGWWIPTTKMLKVTQ